MSTDWLFNKMLLKETTTIFCSSSSFSSLNSHFTGIKCISKASFGSFCCKCMCVFLLLHFDQSFAYAKQKDTVSLTDTIGVFMCVCVLCICQIVSRFFSCMNFLMCKWWCCDSTHYSNTKWEKMKREREREKNAILRFRLCDFQ